jgi:hypothetical protein
VHPLWRQTPEQPGDAKRVCSWLGMRDDQWMHGSFGGTRRRRWSIEEKREIVAESLQPGIGPSEIIRKHGISSGQLYMSLSTERDVLWGFSDHGI